MRDKQGRELLQYQEYKKFSYLTVLFFAIAVGLIVLINGIALIVAINQFFTMLQDGGIESLLNGGMPGLPGGVEIPTELQEYY
jgi:hypothetical protein